MRPFFNEKSSLHQFFRFLIWRPVLLCDYESMQEYNNSVNLHASFDDRYEMLLVCAAKTAASALRLPHGPAGNISLLSNGALETTAYAYSLIQSRSNRRKGGFGTSKGLQCVCKVCHGARVVQLRAHQEFGVLVRGRFGIDGARSDEGQC